MDALGLHESTGTKARNVSGIKTTLHMPDDT